MLVFEGCSAVSEASIEVRSSQNIGQLRDEVSGEILLPSGRPIQSFL